MTLGWPCNAGSNSSQASQNAFATRESLQTRFRSTIETTWDSWNCVARKRDLHPPLGDICETSKNPRIDTVVPLDSFSDRLDRAQRGRCSKCGLDPYRVKGSWPTCCTTTHPRENVQSGGSARQLRHSNRNEDHEKDQQKNAVFTRRTVLHTRVKKQHDTSNI